MTRNELYRAVWSDPVFHVARRIGISNRSLIDACRISEVPTPPRGYWRRVQTGQTPEKAPLARPEDDSPVHIDLDARVATPLEKPATTVIAKDEPTPLSTAKTSAVIKEDWLEIPSGETRSASAIKAEYQNLLSLAGMFERHQLVANFLAQLDEAECKESLRTATIIRQWSALMRRRHAEASPVEQILAQFRALSFSRQKPAWWESP